MRIAYISLGSNLGDRETTLRAAMARLSSVGTITAVSRIYETAPMENIEQPWFLNCVVELKTEATPEQLLQAGLKIEQEFGRRRNEANKKGPRTLDIDLILMDEEVRDAPNLKLPHPQLADRRFVLVPLVEIAPSIRHPITGRTAREMLENIGDTPDEVRAISIAPTLSPKPRD
jgi:2-amino-4-hydroxy-6-hydroxymethyldihydropteridine diphosphokinase